ncbi:10120_t:CDS:2, partial [Cetraspora pellucida]
HKNLNDDLEGQVHFNLQFDVDLNSIYEHISPVEVTIKHNPYIDIANSILCNSRYSLISVSSCNPWQEIHLACNLEKLDNNNHLLNNDNNEPSTINTVQEIYETNNDNLMNEIKQKHARIYQVLSEAQCILNESKACHNRLKFLENMESKVMPVEKLVKDILQHEKRHSLPQTWKDSNENTQYYG